MSFRWIEIKSLAITCKTRRITLTSDLLLFSNFSTKGRFIARPAEWRFGGRFIQTTRHVRLYNIMLCSVEMRTMRRSPWKSRVRTRSRPQLCRQILVLVGYKAVENDTVLNKNRETRRKSVLFFLFSYSR